MGFKRTARLMLLCMVMVFALTALAGAADDHEHHDHDHDHEHHDELLAGAEGAAAPAPEEDHTPEHHDHEHGDEHHDHEHGEEDHGHSHGVSAADYAAAIARGEDPCAAEVLANYDMAMHIASVFILLGVSLLGSLGPLGLHRLCARSTPMTIVIRLGSYFGFGTMLATSLIHMILPAAMALSSPCLASFWSESYEAWAYLFVMLAVLCMHLVDYLIKGYYRRRGDLGNGTIAGTSLAHGCCTAAVVGALVTTDLSPPSSHNSSKAAAESEAKENEPNDEEAGEPNDEEAGECPTHGDGCKTLIKHAQGAGSVCGLYLAEAGIIFHSVMIGLTLGVTTGSSFTTLLIALAFHQFFEGLALGSAAVEAGLSTLKTAILGIAYSVTTPAGIALGIGIHETFNANSSSTLLVTGILDALSAGILLYVVLVQLLAPMFTDSNWLHGQRWYMQVLAFAALYGGAAAMAVIGKWA